MSGILLILAAICFFIKFLASVIPALSVNVDLIALGLFLWVMSGVV